MLEHEGFPAVATASSAVANSLGYRDGERLTRETAFDRIAGIVSSVDVPVTADIESGYGDSLDELAESIARVIDAGVVGINLEDSVVEGVERRSVDEQCRRLSTARAAAERAGLELVINARIDAFLDPRVLPDDGFADVVERAPRYVEAGADVVYPIGPCDAETVIRLRSSIDAPLNILIGPHAPPVAVFREVGIERLSLGPFLHRAAVGRLMAIVRELRDSGSYGAFGDDHPTGANLARYLLDEPEE